MKSLYNKKLVITFAFLMVATSLMTPLVANADFWQNATIGADGVRLRKWPVNGTVLELMYKGEQIMIDPSVIDHENSAWVYVQRVKTGTIGWMEGSFYEHQ